MRLGAILTLVVFVTVAASCGGQSSSNGGNGGDGDSGSGSGGTSAVGGTSGTGGSSGTATGGSGGTATGGSAGTTTGGSSGTAGSDENCNDERRALRELIDDNKACTDTSECVTHLAGCGISEDDCTGAVYTNGDMDQALFDYHHLRLLDCVRTHEGGEGCLICDRVPRSPTCSDGRCIGASACELQAAALWHFKSRNDACETDDDCVTEFVGCEVTEDDCTGAVYYAADFDRAEFERLRDEYYACRGMCGMCRRIESPPGCVSGRCQILPLR